VYWALAAGKTVEMAMQSGLIQVAGAAARQTLNGGRQTIIDMAKHEPYYHGWIRVSDGKPCSFCAMLLSRGPVYWSQDTAGEGEHWHDSCACSVRPFASGDPWPEANQRYRDLWNQTKHDKSTDPAIAFRRAIENRVAP
jgi:hypothetical protein